MNSLVKKAVAVKYAEGLDVPVIMAKGEGASAQNILAEAQKNDILIQEDSVLVDFLGMQSVGEAVPEEAWTALAKIFAFILENGGK